MVIWIKKRKMMVNEFTDVLHISEDNIRLQTKDGILQLKGKKLTVEAFMKDEILITGMFISITFPYE